MFANWAAILDLVWQGVWLAAGAWLGTLGIGIALLGVFLILATILEVFRK